MELEPCVSALRSCPAFPHKPTVLPKPTAKRATAGTKAGPQLPKGQNTGSGPARPTLHVSLLVGRRHSCGQLGTAPKGQELKEVGGTSSCRLGPLGGHSQPCCSSSSQTMRVIFSQRFNTSQLARVQGGSPPPSPPRQQSLAPPTAYAQAASASLFISFPRSSSWCPAAPPTRVKL